MGQWDYKSKWRDETKTSCCGTTLTKELNETGRGIILF